MVNCCCGNGGVVKSDITKWLMGFEARVPSMVVSTVVSMLNASRSDVQGRYYR